VEAPPERAGTPRPTLAQRRLGCQGTRPLSSPWTEGDTDSQMVYVFSLASAFFYGLASVMQHQEPPRPRSRSRSASNCWPASFAGRCGPPHRADAAAFRPACRRPGAGTADTGPAPPHRRTPLRPGAGGALGAPASQGSGMDRRGRSHHGPRGAAVRELAGRGSALRALPSVGSSVAGAWRRDVRARRLGKEGRSPSEAGPARRGRWGHLRVTDTLVKLTVDQLQNRGIVEVVDGWYLYALIGVGLLGLLLVPERLPGRFLALSFPPSRRSSRSPAAPWVCSCSPSGCGPIRCPSSWSSCRRPDPFRHLDPRPVSHRHRGQGVAAPKPPGAGRSRRTDRSTPERAKVSSAVTRAKHRRKQPLLHPEERGPRPVIGRPPPMRPCIPFGRETIIHRQERASGIPSGFVDEPDGEDRLAGRETRQPGLRSRSVHSRRSLGPRRRTRRWSSWMAEQQPRPGKRCVRSPRMLHPPSAIGHDTPANRNAHRARSRHGKAAVCQRSSGGGRERLAARSSGQTGATGAAFSAPQPVQ